MLMAPLPVFFFPGFRHNCSMKIIVLGSGTSHGIPVVGCSCPVCKSNDPWDKRMRSSLYIEGPGGESILIDAGPDFRMQALAAGITRLDAIFLTHSHADHIHGLDDIRPLSHEKPLPIYGNAQTIAEMKERFSYVFGTVWGADQEGGGKPKLSPFVANGPIRMGRLIFTPIPVKHGALDILGWEVREDSGKIFLYLTDTSAVPPSSLALLGSSGLRNSRLIIIGGLRRKHHETHFTFDEALETALGLGADRIYLTHICHEHPHSEIEKICQSFRESRKLADMDIHPAWDGMELTL